ncbi:hypothetical protein KAFR_0D01610 [Kazachstania africana CBS 2517]|uniref:Uncharacterized protein n=1 Tax=Kazachstania africana (strain ATCC 22294 / BCRC 22015 / CBS 2517 / CECT 1963 / NBRC 1671 / NRRL Y-8276) TaxID=1071382 RepID=H2ATV7_KAZAF|nr:hypothetical protein KAFR_0D01610 [Kazachstania africana CBS 2517]CCF57807.1 hypothetical protein KAFR_0D01610 [Kazachstania africana CBS 2517]
MSKFFKRAVGHDGNTVLIYPNNNASQTTSLNQEVRLQPTESIRAARHGKSKYVERLKTYPLVQETVVIIEKIPVTRVLYANTKPVVKAILNSKPVQKMCPVTPFVDNVAVQSLKLTEKVVPCIKTKRYQDIHKTVVKPAVFTKNCARQIINTTVMAGDTYLYKPVHGQILNFRKFYNRKIYDTKGKPLIRGNFDPFILPLNNAFENLMLKYLPNATCISTDDFSCEVDRSVALSFNFILNAIPAIEHRKSELIWSPCNYVAHINRVTNKNLDKQPDLSCRHWWPATVTTFTELEREAVTYIKQDTPVRLFLKKRTRQEIAPAVSATEEIQEVQELPAPAHPEPHEILVNVE